MKYELVKQLKEAKGENNNNWKGDAANYYSKHQYLTRNFGRPKCCDFCDIVGKEEKGGRWSIHYALKKDCEYSHNINDYYKLCRRCHGKYDFTENKRLHLIKIAKAQKGNKSKEKSKIAINKIRNKYGRFVKTTA